MRTAAPSGKRLWLLWVIATNLGWFPGIALGSWLGSHLPAESLSVLVSGLIAGAFVGAAQARVLPRAIAGILAWPVASSIGWALGVLAGRTIVEAGLPELAGIGRLALVALVGGAVVGVPQAFLMGRKLPRAGWWIPASAIGWGTLLPGALTGLVLVWLTGKERPA